MTGALRILRAGPVTTVQDAGRPGMLQHGIIASGPMDSAAFRAAGALLGVAGPDAIEFSTAGIEVEVSGTTCRLAFGGGEFRLRINGKARDWPSAASLKDGDRVEVRPGRVGNYGYLRLDRSLDLPLVLGSRATNSIAGLGGLEGRALRAGDVLPFGRRDEVGVSSSISAIDGENGPIRFIWGIHADQFSPGVREAFVGGSFAVSSRLDRMGVRLVDTGKVFANAAILSLVSDAVVPGDIQILGDATPIVLMRDHQPTGGYPRIGTVITADLDRFAQMRPGAALAFAPVSLQKARELYLKSIAR